MSITEDASTPTPVTTTGTTNPTTASFSPPANSLLVAMVGGGWASAKSTSATISDSGGHTWNVGCQTNGSNATGTAGGCAYVFWTYLTSAPGAITVSAAFTNLSGGTLLDVRVLNGAASQQLGGGIGSQQVTGNVQTGANVAVPLSAAGSLVYGVIDDNNHNDVITAVAGTTLLKNYNDTTDSVSLASFQLATPASGPGTVTVGGTLAANAANNVAAMEIIPAGATLPTRRNWSTNPAAGTDTTGWGAAGTGNTGARVTGLGGSWQRPTGFQLTEAATPVGTAIGTPKLPAVAGQTWAVSVQAACSVTRAATAYLNFTDANGAFLSPNPSQSVTLTSTPQTITFTGTTAPANTFSVGVTVEGSSFAAGDLITMSSALFEQAPTVGSYADGDTSGWAWDGTAEDSTSRLFTATLAASATLAGAGSVTSSATRTVPGAATLTATGGLSASGSFTWAGTATLAGAAAVTAAASITAAAGVTLTGGGAVTATATVTTLPTTALAAAGALTAAGSAAVPGAATLAATGSLSSSATATALPTVPLAGAGVLSATGNVGVTITLPGAGQVIATAAVTTFPEVTLAGSGSVVASATRGQPVAATLTGAGALTAPVTDVATVTAAMAGAGALTLTASRTALPTAALAGAGSLTESVMLDQFTGATLAAVGALTGSAVFGQVADANLVGTSALSATGTRGQAAVAALAGAGALTVSGVLAGAASTALTGLSLLVAGATRVFTAAAVLAAAGRVSSAAIGAKYVPYVPEGWTDNSLATPLSAARLNYMETGMVSIDNSQQGKAPLLVPAPVQTAAYSAQVSDLVPVDLTTQSVAVTLPTSPADKSQVGVEIVTAGASHTCTVVTGGTDVLYKTGGGTTYTLSVQGENALFEYQLSGAIWHVVSSGAPRSTLDSRYVQSVTAGNGTISVGGTASAPTISLGTVPESAITNLTSDLAGKVTSVTAADSTITVGGTATAPTVKVGSIAESQVTNLTSDLAGKAPTASPTFTGVVTVPHVAGSGTAPTATAGANNGTTPPAPVITGNDLRGKVTFGSGTSPAAGAQVTVTFATAYATAPIVTLTATTSTAQALGAYISAVSTTAFTVSTTNAPAASQANTVYGLNFTAIG